MFRKRIFEDLGKLALLVVFCIGLIAARPKTVAQDLTYSISGRVMDAGNNIVADVGISDGIGHTTSTDITGDYILSGLDAGTYTITPSKPGYTFLPPSREVTVPPDGADQDFTAQEISHTISGNAGVGGTLLSYFDGVSKNVVADGGGDYSLAVSYGWSGTVTPSKAGYSFSPVSRDYTNILADGINENYTSSQNEYTLTVTSAHGVVAMNPNQATYHEGDVVELTATPSIGWSFTSWTGDLTSSTNPDSVVIHGNTAVTANYTQNEYTLTVTSAHGTVARNPNQATYHEGDVVELTATPSIGWSFTNWIGELTGNASPDSITIHGNTAVTANYTINTYALNVSKSGTGNGTVTSSPVGISCGLTCSHIYDYNTTVTLTAVASTGSTFTGWSGGGCSGTGTCVVTITAATTVTANFTLQTPLLTVNKGGTGSGTVTSNPVGISCGSTCSHAYNYNTAVTLTATASTGSNFTGWSGGSCSGIGTCAITMTTATTVTANFSSDIVPPSVSWIEPVGDEQGYDVYNETIQLEVNASDNNAISKVVFYRWDYVNEVNIEIGTVNNSPYRLNFNTSALLPAMNQITVNAYDTNNNLTSKYIWLNHLEMPVITVNKMGSGSGKVISEPVGFNCGSDCSEAYAYDTVVTLVPVAFAGSTFTGWSGGGCSGTGTCVITISTTLSVTAAFSVNVSAPNLQSPRANLVTNIKTPTFRWMGVKGAETYEIMFAANSAFTTDVESHPLNEPSYVVSPPLNDGKYYWRVRAYNDSNQPGTWSSARAFTIDTAGPSIPVLSSPANTVSSKRTPTFKWLAVPGAVLYEFQYDNGSISYTVSTRSNFRKPPAMGVGTYSWHVRAKDVVGNWSNWSAPFTVTITAP